MDTKLNLCKFFLKQTIRMSLMVVLGYTFAWLPYNVVALLAKYHRSIGDSDHFPYVFVACHWLAMSHSVYNPVIYFWLNDSFRYTVLEVFCRKMVRNSERRRLSSHLSWRNSTLVTSSGRSGSVTRSISKMRMSVLQTPPQTPDVIPPGSFPGSPLIKIPEEKVHLMNGSTVEIETVIENGAKSITRN